MNVGRWIYGLPSKNLPTRLAALAILILLSWGGVIFAIPGNRGGVGMAAASLAAGVCLASSAAALWISEMVDNSPNALMGVVLPMVSRVGLPLSLAAAVRLFGQGLVEAGFVYYLIGFYLLALMVELPMSLPRACGAIGSALPAKEIGPFSLTRKSGQSPECVGKDWKGNG
jgi:hypothetical protein